MKIRKKSCYCYEVFVDESGEHVPMPKKFQFKHDGMIFTAINKDKHYPAGHGEPAVDGNEIDFIGENGEKAYIYDFIEVNPALSEYAKVRFHPAFACGGI